MAKSTRHNLPAKLVLALLASGVAASGCVLPGHAMDPYYQGPLAPEADGGFADIGYAQWNDTEPAYRLYPGDQVELVVPSAPEFNKASLDVGQDGRIILPAVGPIMAANRSVEEIRADAIQLYSERLIRPNVEMTVKAAPMKVFVGGEVGNPGAVDMNGDLDAFRAILQAGSFKPSANMRKVIIIRRGENGLAMMRTTNLADALRHGDQPDLVPLRRMDIIYVPRSGAAQAGLFMQQYFRDVLPFSFSYAINGTTR